MPKTKSKTQTWEDKIAKQLVGRKIVEVRWMTPEEANESYWDYQPVLLILDDGIHFTESISLDAKDLRFFSSIEMNH